MVVPLIKKCAIPKVFRPLPAWAQLADCRISALSWAGSGSPPPHPRAPFPLRLPAARAPPTWSIRQDMSSPPRTGPSRGGAPGSIRAVRLSDLHIHDGLPLGRHLPGKRLDGRLRALPDQGHAAAIVAVSVHEPLYGGSRRPGAERPSNVVARVRPADGRSGLLFERGQGPPDGAAQPLRIAVGLGAARLGRYLADAQLGQPLLEPGCSFFSSCRRRWRRTASLGRS